MKKFIAILISLVIIFLFADVITIAMRPSASCCQNRTSLAVSHEPVTVTDYGDYLQYEFIMPYHSVRATIMQGQE